MFDIGNSGQSFWEKGDETDVGKGSEQLFET